MYRKKIPQSASYLTKKVGSTGACLIRRITDHNFSLLYRLMNRNYKDFLRLLSVENFIRTCFRMLFSLKQVENYKKTRERFSGGGDES
jgi:hypothetical protein